MQIRSEIFAVFIAGIITPCSAADVLSVSGDTSNTFNQAEALVKEVLKDPASATFRNWRVTYRTVEPIKPNGVCGEVNSKNSFGGYTGYKDVYVTLKGKVTIDQGRSEGVIVRMVCRNASEAEFDRALEDIRNRHYPKSSRSLYHHH